MEIKIILKLAVLFATTFCLFSCGDLKNPKERNKLVFNDSKIAIADSIKVMNKILLKTNRKYFIYGVDSNQLYVENNLHSVITVGFVTNDSLYRNNSLSFIDTLDRRRFVMVASYLNKNYITRCNFEDGQFQYLYRDNIYMADKQTDLDRFIVFANSEQEIDLTRYKILDSRKNLYLLADKYAKIWEN